MRYFLAFFNISYRKTAHELVITSLTSKFTFEGVLPCREDIIKHGIDRAKSMKEFADVDVKIHITGLLEVSKADFENFF